MTARQSRSACLANMPAEILLEIFSNLDIASVFALSSSSKSLHELFLQQRPNIIIPVLSQEFSPFDELLQIYTATANDISDGQALYQRKSIVFRRYTGSKGYVFEPHMLPMPALADYHPSALTGSKSNGNARAIAGSIILGDKDIKPIIDMCLLVRKWEDLFPQMRWFHEAENCRLLRSHESCRFRRALYRWWLYGNYFHGEMPRPHIGLPAPLVQDVRTSQLRYYSTSELLELMDFLETIKDVILHYICPRLDPNYLEPFSTLPSGDAADRARSINTDWSDQSHWGRIIKTYAKLSPRDLMHYFENIYSYPRERLINDIRVQRPGFTFDQASIQVAIRSVLGERQLEHQLPSLAEGSEGGIIDFDDERDGERAAFGNDGSPDGSLPAGCKGLRSLSRYSPRGDDGSYLEDLRYMDEFDLRGMETAVRA